ncbi:MAG: alkaline phosphatase family protein [Armatimonadota bacterium]
MTIGCELLNAAWAAGKLVRPDHTAPNFIDLMQAQVSLAGAPVDLTANGQQLAGLIGQNDHFVFVLADGMGSQLLERLPADSFLRTHCRRELQAVFPATTACATLSMVTGTWPAQHGTPGWWTYLDEHDLSVTTLLFIERFSHQPLTEYGIAPSDLWPLPVLMPQMTHDALLIQPAVFWDSSCSRYMRGGCAGYGYANLAEAADVIIQRIAKAEHPTFTNLYIPDFDTTGHQLGIWSEQAGDVLQGIDAYLEQLAERLAGRARLVITADHGQVDVPVENRLALYDGNPLLELLCVPPTGGHRAASYHVRKSQKARFAEAFTARFGDHIALLSSREAEELEIFGPAPMTLFARRRFGDFISINLESTTLHYYRPDKTPAEDDYGNHCGMSPDEMLVPLILA